MYQTDSETISDLDKLWQKISELMIKANEGVTKADGVLEQAKEVEVGITRAEDIKLEVAQQLHDAKSQVKQVQKLCSTVEKRIKTLEQLGEQIKSAIDEVGDLEVLEALKQEIRSSRSDLAKSQAQLQEIRQSAEKTKVNVCQIAENTEKRFKEITQVKSDVGQLRKDVVSVIEEIGGKEGLERLRQDYQGVRDALINVGNQVNNEAQEKLQALRDEALRAEERLILTRQQVEQVNESIATVRSALVQQAMSEVEKVLQRVQVQEALVLSQLQSVGDTIGQPELLKLKLENMEQEQKRLGKLLRRSAIAIWGILGMVAILTALVVGKLMVLVE